MTTGGTVNQCFRRMREKLADSPFSLDGRYSRVIVQLVEESVSLSEKGRAESMDTSRTAYREMLTKRPLNVQALWGTEDLGLVSGRDVVVAARESESIILAANARSPLTVKGVFKAAKACNAAVYIEIAKSEDSYCYGSFASLPDYAARYSAELGHGIIFGLHVDHYGIKSREDVQKSVAQIPDIVRRGWTSFAVDASHLQDWENLCATRDVCMSIPAYLGLEVEVGEIKGPGELSTVKEALFFIGGLNSWGISPDLLAISNGSLHGTYDTTTGQHEGIDLDRTLEIANAIRPYGVAIAQHGISGTPLSKVSRFRKFGIAKGNVATLFQNVVFGLKMDPETGNAVVENGSYVKEPDRGISSELWNRIVEWADGKKYSRKSGDYKKANLPFGEAIMNEPQPCIDRIVAETEEWATRFLKAFNAEGTAEKVLETIARRPFDNAAPERPVLHKRSEFTCEGAQQERGSDADYSD